MNALYHRTHALDTMAAVLPTEQRDELAALLTSQDVETLRHLVADVMGVSRPPSPAPNTRRHTSISGHACAP